ncbi:MAG TPA: M1 family metallopeptidase [Acidimicrobiales bacterium]|nr:M1 family metallopeptidase [Acidimicrobiales bacterium]
MPDPHEPAVAAPDEAYRLPRTAEPHRYRLVLEPDLGEATFTGTAEIELTLHEPGREIVCNAQELTVTDAVLDLADGSVLAAAVSLDPAGDRVTFSFDRTVPAGPATLRCRFDGILNDKLRGFYRSTFTDESGTTHTIATTQMEATDARRAFPCWDEPDRKAVFDITLVVGRGLDAFSNSPVVDERTEEDGKRRLHFAPTMKMSTYLVAFVVGPLEATDPVDVDGVPVRVVHAPGKGGLTDFSLEVAAHALRFFASYFDLPYPADKLDLVAIPDFAFGAMENLGCVTFRETALLVDPSRAARTELERVADVVAHEIAHMWFGDLVTMRWWEGIWLNEAFATFMEVLCVDAFRPSWQRWVSFGIEREAALAVDGLHATRPIEYPVGPPEEADGMFDVLTYQKGGSVLRMLEQYLGADTFRDGVRAYLRTHAYGNTVTADLWDALESASGEPVRSVMNSWILQGGHPLVSLRDGRLSQQPFRYTETPPFGESAIGDHWEVPVFLRSTSGGAPLRLLLGSEPMDVSGTGTSGGGTAGGGTTVVNAGGWGVYRVAYDAEQLARLGRGLPALTPLERSNLFADTWASVLAGHVALESFLGLAAGLGDDDEPSTFAMVAGALGLCDRIVGDELRPLLAAATRALLTGRAGQLGWDPRPEDGERTPSLRALLLGTLGTLGQDPAVRDEAVRRFEAANPTAPGTTAVAIDADIEDAVLGVVAAQVRTGDYEACLARYRDPATPQEEVRYLTSLAAFPDAGLAARTFDLAITEVRTQNAPYLVMSLLGNRVGGPVAWELLKAGWEDVLERFPVNGHSRMLAGVRSLCGDAALADDVTRFLTEHPVRSGQRSVEQTLERLRINVAFGARERPGLASVLSRVADAAGG